jgi:uncharacterized repeat protein (TIGR02543 family)
LSSSTSYYVRVAAKTANSQSAYAYPWTRIFHTGFANRDANGQIIYETGRGLGDNLTALTRTDFTRVRYYVEASPAGGPSKWVDVNFSKTLTNKNSTANPSEDYSNLFMLQMPVPAGGNNSQFEIHGTVSDLTFTSSGNSGLGAGSGGTARLEIWPWNYDPAPAAGLSGGTLGANYDDGDSYASASGYGSFQIHGLSAGASPLVAWNHQFNAVVPEIGFGPQPASGHINWNPDWTFAAQFSGYVPMAVFSWQSFANLSVQPTSNYIVTYEYNGSDGGENRASDTFTGGQINLPVPTKLNHSFAGWYSDSNFSSPSIVSSPYTPSASITLYAKWLEDLMAYEPFSGSGNLAGSAGTGSTGLTGNWIVPPARKQDSAAQTGVRTSRPNLALPGNSGFTIPASNVAASGNDWRMYYSARQLQTPISFDANGTQYLSFISHTPRVPVGSSNHGSTMAGLLSGLPATDADTTPWSLMFGSGYTSKFVINYGNANRATWLAEQTRLTTSQYSAVGSKDSAGTTEQTAFFVVVKITTSASGNDSMALRAYAPSETLPLTEPTDWDVQYSAPISGTANYLAVETEYHGTVDEVRLGRTYAAVADPRPPFVAPVPPTNDYFIEFAGSSRASARGGSVGSPVGIVPSSQSFSWEAWINPTAPTSFGQRYILDSFSGAGSDGAARLWIHGSQNNAIYAFRYDSIEAGRSTVTWNSETNYVRYGEWQHVAVTYQRANEGDCSSATTVTATLYINGVQAGQNSSTNMGCLAPKGLSIGDATEDAFSNEFYAGKIDQVKIWEGALTQAEVASSMASYARGSIDNTLRAHYSFNELGSSPTSGDVIANLASSGASYNLALYSQTPSNVASNVTRELNSFNVNYDSNGADSGSVGSSASGPYKDVSISGQGSMLRSTYSFAGWHTTASGTGGVDYAASATYPMSYRDLDLYAQWTSLLQSVTPTLSYSNATYSPSGVVVASINANNHDGTPTFTSDSGNICSVDSDGDATILRTGTCSISASFPQTSNYRSAVVSASFTISRAAQAALVWDATKISYDYLGNLDLSGIVSGGSGDGTLSFSATGCTITGLTLSGGSPVSNCRVTVTKGADVNYSASAELDQDITINKINQAALSVTNPGTVRFGDTIHATAVGGSGTGAVTFNSTSSAVCTETSNDGEFEIIGVGDCVITVSKAADANYNSQSGSRTVTTLKASHTVSFSSNVPATPTVNDTYNLTGSSSTGEAGLAPSFRILAGSSSICSLSGSTVSFLLDGVCEIEAFKDATTNYLAAQTVTQRIVVGQANQTITFATLTNKTFGDPAFTVSATSSSNNAVTFSSGAGTTNSACSVTSGGLVVVSALGLCEVVANSASGNGYAAASPISRTFQVQADTAGAPFITAVSFGDQSLTATYFAPSYLGGGTISGYRLQAFSGSTLVATSSSCATSGTLSCTISGLTNGTSYTLKIAAVTEAGLGAVSPASSAMTPASTPAAVSALTAVQGNQKLTLTWRAPSNLGGGTLDSFRVYHRIAGGSYPNTYINLTANEATAATTAGVTELEITGLINGQAYDVKVITVTTANLANLTSATTEVTQTPYTVPDAPLSVTVLDMPNDIVITWSQPVFDGGSAIDGYSVLLDSVVATCAATSATSCTIPKNTLTPGTTINIGVKAENDAGYSAPANTSFQVASAPVLVPPVVVTPGNPITGPATGIEAVEGQSWAWTKRISANQVKVYIKFPEMGANYQIQLQKNDGKWSRKMSKTITSTSDADLLVVGDAYYLVRTLELPGEGQYRIQITESGDRITLNGKDRPAVYNYR